MQINVLQYLQKANIDYSEKIAYQDENESITFSQVMEQAKQIGTVLCEHTNGNKPIIVLSSKSIYVPSMYMGVVYAGCFYIPLSVDLPIFRLKMILDIVCSDIILTDGQNNDIIDSLDYKGRVISISDTKETVINEAELELRTARILDTDPLYVIFTSGSSGKPKGVLTSHRSVVDYIDVFARTFEISNKDIFGNQAPLDYIAAIRDIFLPMLTGAKTILISKSLFSTPKMLFDYINKNNITTLCWVAPALALCADLKVFDSEKLLTVNKVFFTGSVLSGRHLRIWQTNLPNATFVNHYGPTEITASCTYYIVDKLFSDLDVVPIGIPFSNTGIILIDEDNNAVHNGELGEICVKGSSLALGYYRDSEKTNEVFCANPLQDIYKETIYKTGDLGVMQPDGNLSFHGRKDFQVKHMGHRIELSEIEIIINSMEKIKGCCCLYNHNKEQIWLFYSGEYDNRDVSIHLRELLPAYMVPRKFVKLDDIPKIFNGKIDMEALKKMMEGN